MASPLECPERGWVFPFLSQSRMWEHKVTIDPPVVWWEPWRVSNQIDLYSLITYVWTFQSLKWDLTSVLQEHLRKEVGKVSLHCECPRMSKGAFHRSRLEAGFVSWTLNPRQAVSHIAFCFSVSPFSKIYRISLTILICKTKPTVPNSNSTHVHRETAPLTFNSQTWI